MKTFKQFIEATGLMKQDFSSLSLQDRMAQGRDIGEPFIIARLAEQGVEITPSRSYHADARLKIDGFLNGDKTEPVQIKLRRSSKNGRNDIAFEVCRNHNSSLTLNDQLKNPQQQGRDWQGTSVKHYFVLNQQETEIYHVSAAMLKEAVIIAIQELNNSRAAGMLRYAFTASNGVDLRPTNDPDPNSFTPNKVMAFIPAEMVKQETYSAIAKPKPVEVEPAKIPAKIDFTPKPILGKVPNLNARRPK